MAVDANDQAVLLHFDDAPDSRAVLLQRPVEFGRNLVPVHPVTVLLARTLSVLTLPHVAALGELKHEPARGPFRATEDIRHPVPLSHNWRRIVSGWGSRQEQTGPHENRPSGWHGGPSP